MFERIILFLCVVAEIQFSQCLNVKPCEISDTGCLIKSYDYLYKVAITGDDSLNLPSLDPMKHEYIEGDLNVIKYKLYNSTIVGFKECNVFDSNIDLEKNFVKLKILCPKVDIFGIYEISGVLITMPIEGKGDYTVKTKDYQVSIDGITKIFEKNGVKYIQLKSYEFNGDLQGGMEVGLKNLFNGKQKELAEATLKFANQQYKVVSKILQGPIFIPILKRMVKNINKLFKNVPLNHIISNV